MVSKKQNIKIGLKEFTDAHSEYPPNWWVKIAYKYFSQDTEKSNMAPSWTVVVVLFSLFLVGLTGTILEFFGVPFNPEVIRFVTIAYGLGVFTLVISLFGASLMNRARLNKVRKALGGISKEEYDAHARQYGEFSKASYD